MACEPRLVGPTERTRGEDVHVANLFMPDNFNPVKLVCWDFAGHDDYHSTHSVFLADGALVLLVVDLARFVNDPSSRNDAIHTWLDTLLCRTPGAVVQIVATHTDELRQDQDIVDAAMQLREADRKSLCSQEQTVRLELEKKRGRGGDAGPSDAQDCRYDSCRGLRERERLVRG